MSSVVVSIITPNYNGEKYIAQAIESVLSQDFHEWEMLIVDDYSTDGSIALIKFYQERDSRIKLISLEENQGPSKTRNLAIKESQGRYIAFLDNDDYWAPQKLSTQLSFMQANSFAFTYTGYHLIEEDDTLLSTYHVPAKVDYHNLLKTCVIGCLTVIYDTAILGKVYMPELSRRQDYGLWLSLLKKVDFAHGINEPLAYYRVRKNSISSNKLIAAKYIWKVFREVEHLSFPKSIYYFFFFAISGIKKYWL